MATARTADTKSMVQKLGESRVGRHVALPPHTTFKIGGPADYFYEARSADELAAAVTAARETGVQYFVLGLGANILVGDGGFRGLVIKNAATKTRIGSDGKLWAESGAVFRDLIQETVHA